MWRLSYNRMAENQPHLGDFELLFGTARLDLEIVDLPIRYGERRYRSTNRQQWPHGLLFLGASSSRRAGSSLSEHRSTGANAS
jgi:hypothetical protein